MAKTFIKDRFGVTPNELLNDEEISFKAKGLYAYIQSKPENWDFTLGKIAFQSKEGVESIRNAVKELELAGYLIRANYQNDKGQWDCDYYLYSRPQKPKPLVKQPNMEKPYTDYPNTENPHTIVKKRSNIERVKKINNLADKSASDVSLVIKEFEKVDPKNKTYYGNKTQRASCKFLIEEYGLDKVIYAINSLYQVYSMKTQPDYFPSIKSPYDLKEKWTKIEDAIIRNQKIKTNNEVII